MKRFLLILIMMFIAIKLGSSHDAYASLGHYNSNEYCKLENVPVTDYTLENSCIESDEGSGVIVGDRDSRRDRMQLALARICVSESGFQVRTNDCLLIYHVLRNRSVSGELTMGIMRAYAPKSFNLERTDNHRWISHLRADMREPKYWNETVNISWSNRRDGWREVYEYAGRIIRNEPLNPCGVRVDHWGARYFRRRRLIRSGWIPVECGETRNQFWRLPNE